MIGIQTNLIPNLFSPTVDKMFPSRTTSGESD
ncbi:MAG: hypothetical protein ACD_15C00038G0001, partial [uncultured bacterium]